MKSAGAVFVSAALMFAQSTPAHLPIVRTRKIGNDFAKTALVALKTIESDNSMREDRQGGDNLNRLTLDKISAAGAAAQTTFEADIAEALNRIYQDKLTNNSARSLQELIHLTEDRASATTTDPIIVDIGNRESACFQQFEASLRARFVIVPRACESMHR